MRFQPDETQQAIVQAAGEALDGAGVDLPERTWKALGQAGVFALAVPTWLGGHGLGVLETMLVLGEVGRRAAPVPAMATLALGILPVVRWGSRDQQAELLAGLGNDPVVLTAAIREPSDPMPAMPRTTAGPDLRVTGTKVGVPYAQRARRILVPLSLTAGGSAIALVDPAAPGVTLRPTVSSSGMPECTVRLDNVAAAGILGDGAVEDLYRLAIAGACALGDGAVAGALALTTAHVGTREQFGRPLAAFQAVAQQIADVYIASRTLHLATLSACWRLSHDRMSDVDLDVAAHWLTTEAPAALRTCHQLHGGLGLDVSYPLHRYSALVKDLVRFLGGTQYRLERLGDSDAHRAD